MGKGGEIADAEIRRIREGGGVSKERKRSLNEAT